MDIPLSEIIDGDAIPLFDSLEEELPHTPRSALVIVFDYTTKLLPTYDQMNKRHRKICEKAGLPKEMTFTGFRHGGSTELGDAGVADLRPITGHLQINTTAIYNKLSKEKARQAALLRRQYVSKLSESMSERESESQLKTGAK